MTCSLSTVRQPRPFPVPVRKTTFLAPGISAVIRFPTRSMGRPSRHELAGGRSSVYRFHLDSPIPFTKSFKATIEHGHANHRSDNFYSVAYWYQAEPHAPFPPLPSVEQRLPVVQQNGWTRQCKRGEQPGPSSRHCRLPLRLQRYRRRPGRASRYVDSSTIWGAPYLTTFSIGDVGIRAPEAGGSPDRFGWGG